MVRYSSHSSAGPRYITGLRRKGFVPPLKATNIQVGDQGRS